MYTILLFACSGANQIKDSASINDNIEDMSSEVTEMPVEPSSEEKFSYERTDK